MPSPRQPADDAIEEWRRHPLYPLECTTSGAVRRPGKVRVIRGQDNGLGYRQIPFEWEGRTKKIYRHVLVLETWDRLRPEGHVAMHLNDTPGDDRLENLRWGTHSENQRGTRRGRIDPDLMDLLQKAYDTGQFTRRELRAMNLVSDSMLRTILYMKERREASDVSGT